MSAIGCANSDFWRNVQMPGKALLLLRDFVKQDLGSPFANQAFNAAIFLTILPIMLVYLWVQKYFVQGMLLGSVKGY